MKYLPLTILVLLLLISSGPRGGGAAAAAGEHLDRRKPRGNPSCWTSGFNWHQCCNSIYGPHGNPICWDGEVHTFDTCCLGESFEPRNCREFVAHFDYSVLKLASGSWRQCVELMERRPEICNSAATTETLCKECAQLSPHFVKFISCVKSEQARTTRADGASESEEGDAGPQAAVGGVHYPALFVPRGAGRDFAVAAPAFDAYVGNRLVVDGSWMFHEVQLLVGLSRPGDVIVDAGANIGGFALPLAKHVGPEGRVYAFEPFRLLFQCLNANIMLNGLSNVHTYQVGLGNRSEVIQLRQPNLNVVSNPSKMHVAAQVASEMLVRRDPRPDSAEPVRVMRLDDVDFGKRGPSMVKVDVESMEMPMMQGASETLRKYRPTLYVEDSEAELPNRRGPTKLMRFLYDREYIFVDLVASGFADATSTLFFPRERQKEMMQRLHSIEWKDGVSPFK